MLFMPPVAEMYPTGTRTTVHVDGLTEGLCGASRPGHFDGVTTVVAKLFSIVGPCTAYFGRKDAQQLAVVRRMTADLDLPVAVVGCPLVREPDGVAMSSRNAYLSSDDRRRATVLVAGAACRGRGGGLRRARRGRRARRARTASSTPNRRSASTTPRSSTPPPCSRSSGSNRDTLIAARGLRRLDATHRQHCHFIRRRRGPGRRGPPHRGKVGTR